jgi:hypothetical protein
MGRDDQVGGDQPAARADEAAQERGGDAEGWVRHHPEGTAGEAQVGGVGLHDHKRASEAGPEHPGPAGVELHGHHASAGGQEVAGKRAGTRAHVEDQLSRPDPRAPDQAGGPDVRESVKAPPGPARGGHGGP